MNVIIHSYQCTVILWQTSLDIGFCTIQKSVAVPSLNITEQRQEIMMPTICLFIPCNNAAGLNLYQWAGDILKKKLLLTEHMLHILNNL